MLRKLPLWVHDVGACVCGLGLHRNKCHVPVPHKTQQFFCQHRKLTHKVETALFQVPADWTILCERIVGGIHFQLLLVWQEEPAILCGLDGSRYYLIRLNRLASQSLVRLKYFESLILGDRHH